MEFSFTDIKERLSDPFFEMRYFGKEAVRQRILPIEKYGPAPVNLQFSDWLPEDNAGMIDYAFYNSVIGRILVGSTPKGVCFLGFACAGETAVMTDFMQRFAHQPMEKNAGEGHRAAVDYCNGKWDVTVPLHLKGTGFQRDIWKQLVRILRGGLSNYGSLVSHPGAAQAAGAAVGANPVSYIVPCHRIVKNDGRIEGYHWGTAIKKELLAYEFLL